MWSLRRSGEGPQNESCYYLAVGEHLVGRKDCQIQIAGDQSVSRKHAWIKVTHNGATTAQISLKDVSKFGCLVNGVKCQNSVEVILKHSDKITFGTQNCSYRLKNEPLVVFASCLENAKKKNLKFQLSKLGGCMVNEWQRGCSHLVMEVLSFTVKVIYALVTCCPIVTPTFFDDMVQAIESKKELPSPAVYIPPVKENLLQALFHPNEARKLVFAGKLFLFLEEKQFKKLEQAIVLAGGKPLLKEIGGACGSDDTTLTDKNTLVMSVDLKTGISDAREAWIGHVGDVLKSVNRRPIAETEVGLAILHVSLDEYCNPSIDHIPKITRQIVSKSISTMEEMSQRMSESQNVSTNQVPEKKTSLLVNDPATNPQDKRKRSCNGSDESQPLVVETPISRNAESKRRKISPSDINHVSQTPEPLSKNPGLVEGISLVQKRQPTATAITDITHISQSEKLDFLDSLIRPESQAVTGQKRKARSPSNDITHISQSQESHRKHDQKVVLLSASDKKVLSSNRSHISQTQESQLKEKSSDASPSGEKKLKLSRSNVNVTHVSQSQFSQNDEKLQSERRDEKKLKQGNSDLHITHVSQSQFSQNDEKQQRERRNERKLTQSRPDVFITHISQSQLSQNYEKPQRERQDEKRLTKSRPDVDVTHVSQSQLPQSEEKSPWKRTDEITHIIQSQNSRVEQSDAVKDREFVIVSPKRNTMEMRIEEAPSPEINFTSKRRKISSVDLTCISDTERSMTTESHPCLPSVTSPTSAVIENTSSASAINRSPVVQAGARGNGVKNDRSDSTAKDIVDSNCIKSIVSPPGSGWMSKKSFSIKKEKMNVTNFESTVHDSNESCSRNGLQPGNTLKESQVFPPKEEERTVKELSEEIAVKKKENVEYPSDVLLVEHADLVVIRTIRPETKQSQKKFSKTLKNMKRFRKHYYEGYDGGLPRIIGERDLVLFSSDNRHMEEWRVEIDAMKKKDLERREKERVFLYEGSNQRCTRR